MYVVAGTAYPQYAGTADEVVSRPYTLALLLQIAAFPLDGSFMKLLLEFSS
jgi:hypothetical protein